MPFMCICGNPYVGYRCIYCVKENDVSEEERNEEHYYRTLDKEALDKAYKENDAVEIAALVEALEGALAAIDMLCSEALAAEVSVGVAISIVGAKEKATEAIRKAKEKRG